MDEVSHIDVPQALFADLLVSDNFFIPTNVGRATNDNLRRFTLTSLMKGLLSVLVYEQQREWVL